MLNCEYSVDNKQKDESKKMLSNLNEEQMDKLLELLEKRKQEKEQAEPVQEIKKEEPRIGSYEWEREQINKRRKEKDFEM